MLNPSHERKGEHVAEFQFRYNNRHNADIFETATGEC